MLLTPLGHTQCLLDIEGLSGSVRILIDSWLSDFCVGDMMGREPRIRIDWKTLKPDIVYISHAHTDHFDPYTLTEIFKVIRPIILLPETLSYLVDTLNTFLDQPKIILLAHDQPQTISGVSFHGLLWDMWELTNEEDVMTLFVWGKIACAFFEIDVIPLWDDEAGWKKLTGLFAHKKYSERVFVAGRNEIEVLLPALDVSSLPMRKKVISEFLHDRSERYELDEEWRQERIVGQIEPSVLPWFHRVITGQWLTLPREIDSGLAAWHPSPIREVTRAESKAQHSKRFPVVAWIPGKSFAFVGGKMTEKNIPAGITFDVLRSQEGISEKLLTRKAVPLRQDITRESFELRLLEILNTRFLIHWTSREAGSLKAAVMQKPSREYLIVVKYSNATIAYSWKVGSIRFEMVKDFDQKMVDEDYFASDILDFLEGRQELYSNFLHSLDPKKTYRLWTCLGANFFNNDLVLKKYQLHFELAKRGESAENYVLSCAQKALK